MVVVVCWQPPYPLPQFVSAVTAASFSSQLLLIVLIKLNRTRKDYHIRITISVLRLRDSVSTLFVFVSLSVHLLVLSTVSLLPAVTRLFTEQHLPVIYVASRERERERERERKKDFIFQKG